MAGSTETYRGVVSAGECDLVEHCTIARYFRGFADATRNLFELIGESETMMPVVEARPSRLFMAFTQELRAGAEIVSLAARRPAPLPPAIREAVSRLLAQA